jgi:hypothetical protein
MLLTKSDLNQIGVLLDEKLEEQEETFERKIVEVKSDFFEKIDPILKEVTASREERVVINGRISEIEERIEPLEKIHPQGKHLAAI